MHPSALDLYNSMTTLYFILSVCLNGLVLGACAAENKPLTRVKAHLEDVHRVSLFERGFLRTSYVEFSLLCA